MENKKEILNQFFEEAINNHLGMILDSFNLQTGEQYYTVLNDYEALKEKQNYINKFYDNNLQYEKCKCIRIENFYLIDIMQKGSDYLC